MFPRQILYIKDSDRFLLFSFFKGVLQRWNIFCDTWIHIEINTNLESQVVLIYISFKIPLELISKYRENIVDEEENKKGAFVCVYIT